MDSDGYKRKRTKPVRVSHSAHEYLTSEKERTGVEFGELIDQMVERCSQTQSIMVSDESYKRLTNYSTLTGMTVPEEVNKLICREFDELYKAMYEGIESNVTAALVGTVKPSPLAMRTLNALAASDGESPEDHIDRTLNAALGLVDWKRE